MERTSKAKRSATVWWSIAQRIPFRIDDESRIFAETPDGWARVNDLFCSAFSATPTAHEIRFVKLIASTKGIEPDEFPLFLECLRTAASQLIATGKTQQFRSSTPYFFVDVSFQSGIGLSESSSDTLSDRTDETTGKTFESNRQDSPSEDRVTVGSRLENLGATPSGDSSRAELQRLPSAIDTLRTEVESLRAAFAVIASRLDALEQRRDDGLTQSGNESLPQTKEIGATLRIPFVNELPPDQHEILEAIRKLPENGFREAEQLLGKLEGQPMTAAFTKNLTFVLREKRWGAVCETCERPSILVWVTGPRYAQGGKAQFSHRAPSPHGSITKIRKFSLVKKIDRRTKSE